MSRAEDRCERCGRSGATPGRIDGRASTLCPACLGEATGVPELGGLMRALQRTLPRTPGREGKCPHCGTTEVEAEESGLVGCPVCYDALSSVTLARLGLRL